MREGGDRRAIVFGILDELRDHLDATAPADVEETVDAICAWFDGRIADEEDRAGGDGVRRTVVAIDEQRCTGCGLCMPDCPAGALEVRDGCSRLADDRCCDGGGACVPGCPHGAIILVEREARPFEPGRRRG